MSRVIAQMLVMGGTYMARALITAYQQALINSARQGGAAATGSKVRSARGIMRTDEAAEILGVRRDAGLKEIQTSYDRLYKANDPAHGGSLYVQAKIHNARTALEESAVARGEKHDRTNVSPPSS